MTYTFSGGRFGDNLIAYIHAKWVSYCCHIPLHYKPFEGSDLLLLDEMEIPFQASRYPLNMQLTLTHKITLNRLLTSDPFEEKLFIIPYFPECEWERLNNIGTDGNPWPYFQVNKHDPGFKEFLRKSIAPKASIAKLSLPKGRIPVAIHFRTVQQAYDSIWRDLPKKFPHESFYIQGLEEVLRYFKGTPLYVHLFTDNDQEAEILERFKSHFSSFDIAWGHNDSTKFLNDFFALTQFKVSIHGYSSFSVAASFISDYCLEILPGDFHIDEEGVKVDTLHLEYPSR